MYIDIQAKKQAECKTDRQEGEQKDRQTHTQEEKLADRETEITANSSKIGSLRTGYATKYKAICVTFNFPKVS